MRSIRAGSSGGSSRPNSASREFAEFVYRVAVAKGLLDSTQAVTSSASLGSLKGLNQLLPCKFSRHRTSHRRRLDRSSQPKCSNTWSSMKTGNTYPRAPPPTRSTHSRAFTTRHDVATDTTRTQTRTSTRATHATSTCTSHARSPPAPLAAASRRLEVEAVPPHQRLMGRGRHLNSNGALPVVSSSKPRSPRARLQCMGG